MNSTPKLCHHELDAPDVCGSRSGTCIPSGLHHVGVRLLLHKPCGAWDAALQRRIGRGDAACSHRRYVRIRSGVRLLLLIITCIRSGWTPRGPSLQFESLSVGPRLA